MDCETGSDLAPIIHEGGQGVYRDTVVNDDMSLVRHSPTMSAYGQEQYVRIGIVLPKDRRCRINLSVDAAGWIVSSATMSTTVEGVVEFLLDGGMVVARNGEIALGRATDWRLALPQAAPTNPASLAIVRDAVAGRGFHWEKSTDVELSDALIVSVKDRSLMLVNELPVERYLLSVITSEMSGQCPAACLESQAIAARSWILAASKRKHTELGIDFCNDDCCQRFHGYGATSDGARLAVQRTRGVVLIHDSGVIVDANYSKCCGGIVEAPQYVWGHYKPGQYAVVDAPAGGPTAGFFGNLHQQIDDFVAGEWLTNCDAFCSPQVIPDANLPRYLGRVDDGESHFRWSVAYDRTHLEEILRAKLSERSEETPEIDTLLDLIPLERGRSGRITSLAIDYRSASEADHRLIIRDQYWIRHSLSDSFLYSSAFIPRIERNASGIPTRIRLIGAGWGHGAGMCQIGALGMAWSGMEMETILRHYFEGSELRRLYY